MTNHNHRHGALGAFAVVAAIAFAFGMRTAQIIVSGVLVAGGLFFAYVMFRVVMGTI